MSKIERAAQLFAKNPTPFTFLIFVVLVLFGVLGSGHLTVPEMNQSVVVWSFELLLLVATVFVVISLVRGFKAPLDTQERFVVTRLIDLEKKGAPPYPKHYIGEKIPITQAALLRLFNRLL